MSLRKENQSDAAARLATLKRLEDAVLAQPQTGPQSEFLRERQAWLAAQNDAFQDAVRGAPLKTSLAVLARTAIDLAGADMRCAFHVANDAGTALRPVVGVLESSAEFREAFRVGPDSMACGLAAHRKEPVLTGDVRKDPRWKDWLWLAAKYGFRACWSFPIEAEGRVVGTLSMYFAEPRAAGSRDLDLAMVLTRAAAIIISRHQEATERARVERALRESEERLKLREAELIQAQLVGGVGGVNVDLRRGIARRSPEYRRLHGLPENRVEETHEDWLQRLHPEDREAAAHRLRVALEGPGSLYESEYRIIRPSDGAVRWISARAEIRRDEEGRAVRLVGAHIDVTERRQAEERLRLSEEKYRTLFESIDQGFSIIEVLFDADGRARDYRFLETNPAFDSEAGLHGVVGRTIRELAPDIEPYWLEIYGHVAASGEPVRFETTPHSPGAPTTSTPAASARPERTRWPCSSTT